MNLVIGIFYFFVIRISAKEAIVPRNVASQVKYN